MVIEHELMHQETLLYILQQLPPQARTRPPGLPLPVCGPGPRLGALEVAREVDGGLVTLGAPFDGVDFGWDNEFPGSRVDVPGFVIDALPVTNAQCLHFLERGGYDDRDLWTEEDWAWKSAMRLEHPLAGWRVTM